MLRDCSTNQLLWWQREDCVSMVVTGQPLNQTQVLSILPMVWGWDKLCQQLSLSQEVITLAMPNSSPPTSLHPIVLNSCTWISRYVPSVRRGAPTGSTWCCRFGMRTWSHCPHPWEVWLEPMLLDQIAHQFKCSHNTFMDGFEETTHIWMLGASCGSIHQRNCTQWSTNQNLDLTNWEVIQKNYKGNTKDTRTSIN